MSAITAVIKNQSCRTFNLAVGCGLIFAILSLSGCAPTLKQQQSKVKIEVQENIKVKIKVQENIGFTIEEPGISGAARERYQAAYLLLAQQRYAEGAALLEQLVEQEPELSAPHVDLAIAYQKQDKLDLAEVHLQEVLAQNPQHPVALNEMGIVYRKTGRFLQARTSYENALAVYPGFHSARRNLGVLCDLYLGDLKCALDNYEAYMETVAEDPDVAIWIADIRNRIQG
jgi:Flp pilus assembly protein TadD